MKHPAPNLVIWWLASSCALWGQETRSAHPVSAEVAAEAAKAFSSGFASRDPRQRLAAADQIVTKKHQQIARCLARALNDRDLNVRLLAAGALGLQAPEDAVGALRGALRTHGKCAQTQTAVLRGFCALERSPPLGDLEREFDSWPIEAQKQALISLRWVRSMQAVEFLGRYLDDPKPENVDSPSNPPAAYWKKKVTAYHHWIGDLHESLRDLTGKDFDSSRQLRDWRKKGGKLIEAAPSKTKGRL